MTIPRGERPPEPEQPYVRIVDNLTTDRLATLALEHPRGQLIVTPEIAKFIGQFDRYANKGIAGADRAFWNRVYDGGPTTCRGRAPAITPAKATATSQPLRQHPGRRPARQDRRTSAGSTTTASCSGSCPSSCAAPGEEDDDHIASQYDAEIRQQVVETLAALPFEASGATSPLSRSRPRRPPSGSGCGPPARPSNPPQVPSPAFGNACGKIENAFGALCLILHLVEAVRAAPPASTTCRAPSAAQTAKRAARIVKEFLIPHLHLFYELLASRRRTTPRRQRHPGPCRRRPRQPHPAPALRPRPADHNPKPQGPPRPRPPALPVRSR